MTAVTGRKAAMPFIMITLLIDMMSIGLIAPVLPKLVASHYADPSAISLGYGAIQLSFALLQFFSAPVLGALSDRFGRRPVLLIGLTGMAINFFVTAFATEFIWLLVVRMFAGMLCANIAVANAYVADITTPETRARNFGLLGAMFGIGFILGPVIGGLLGDDDHRLPFMVSGGLALLNAVYGYFVLPESLAPENRRPFVFRSPFSALARLRQLKGVEPLLWALACTMLTQFTMQTVWLLHTSLQFGWTPKENGMSLFALGMTAAVMQGGLMRPLERKLGVGRLAMVGMLSSVVAYCLWGLAKEPWMMYAITLGNVLGFGIQPSIQSMISNAADASTQGESMGAAASIVSLSAVVGPLMAGPLMATVSHLPRADWRVGIPFFVCAALQGIAAWIAFVYFSRYRSSPAPQAGA
ncbi:MAG: hypothetical protein RLZZ182_227 [Pseudomonadota bacterium]|jgi:DHA1 family tetracycline resistance protein-like MFS transporter